MKNHIVCIASEFKGNEFMEEAHKAGWNVTLVTRQDLHDSKWSWDSINEVTYVPREARKMNICRKSLNLHLASRFITSSEWTNSMFSGGSLERISANL